MKLNFKKIHKNAVIPNYATSGSACFDFKCIEDVVIKPGEVVLVRTGLCSEFDDNFELQIIPRSGLSINYPNYIANSPGCVDSDYRGEIKIIVVNNTNQIMKFNERNRIAQGKLCPICRPEISETSDISETDRGLGGFGSTGLK